MASLIPWKRPELKPRREGFPRHRNMRTGKTACLEPRPPKKDRTLLLPISGIRPAARVKLHSPVGSIFVALRLRKAREWKIPPSGSKDFAQIKDLLPDSKQR